MSANRTISIVLAIAAVLGLWEVWSHLVLTGWPPQMLHWLAGSIGLALALLLATIAARGMWGEYLATVRLLEDSIPCSEY